MTLIKICLAFSKACRHIFHALIVNILMLHCNLKVASPILLAEEIKAKEDGGERIRLLQDKINEMRKVYSSLKAEVASIDRKRKRLKKKRGLFLFPYVFFSFSVHCSKLRFLHYINALLSQKVRVSIHEKRLCLPFQQAIF